jgi:hypothetical protein
MIIVSEKPKNNPSKSISKRKPAASSQEKTGQQASQRVGWLSMRTAMFVMGILSVGMAILTAYQAIPIKGVLGGILWGVAFGGSLWLIFFGWLWINKLFRRN